MAARLGATLRRQAAKKLQLVSHSDLDPLLAELLHLVQAIQEVLTPIHDSCPTTPSRPIQTIDLASWTLDPVIAATNQRVAAALRASQLEPLAYRLFRLSGELCDTLAQYSPRCRLFSRRARELHAFADSSTALFQVATDPTRKFTLFWPRRVATLFDPSKYKSLARLAHRFDFLLRRESLPWLLLRKDLSTRGHILPTLLALYQLMRVPSPKG